MRREHFETLRPVCPQCRPDAAAGGALRISVVGSERDGNIHEGVLQCPRDSCLAEYPVLDGIPILVPDPRAYIAHNILQLIQRDDLTDDTEALMGECCGPGSNLDLTRQHLSRFAWDHYGEFDPQERGEPRPGSVSRALKRILEQCPAKPGSPVLDIGCAAGRSTFDLARRSAAPVLGIDVNFSMLRLAAQVMREGRVRYPRRTSGLLYDRREFDVEIPNSERVDFWCCDGTAPPFADGTFASVFGLNVIDCVSSPLDLLRSSSSVLTAEGTLVLAAPYDWTGAVNDPAAWIGGHSRRSPGNGVSADVLRALLTPGAHPASVAGLELRAEIDDIEWHVRVHDRHASHFRLHAVVATKISRQSAA